MMGGSATALLHQLANRYLPIEIRYLCHAVTLAAAVGSFKGENVMRKSPFTKGHWSGGAVWGALGIAAIVGSALASGRLPPRKPGLWVTTKVIQITMKGSPPDTDNKPRVDAMCTDAETDAIEEKILAGGVIPGSCPSDIQGSGKTFTVSSSCPSPLGGGNVVTHATFVWKSDTEFHSESQSTSPSFSSTAVEDSKWVGACPAGVESGDQGSYIGGVFKKNSNIRDLLKVKGAPR